MMCLCIYSVHSQRRNILVTILSPCRLTASSTSCLYHNLSCVSIAQKPSSLHWALIVPLVLVIIVKLSIVCALMLYCRTRHATSKWRNKPDGGVIVRPLNTVDYCNIDLLIVVQNTISSFKY